MLMNLPDVVGFATYTLNCIIMFASTAERRKSICHTTVSTSISFLVRVKLIVSVVICHTGVVIISSRLFDIAVFLNNCGCGDEQLI